MMRNISKILGLLLLLLSTGCNDSDDVAAIFTGKTWKLITSLWMADMICFLFGKKWSSKTKIYEELNKNGTYNVIFEGTVEGDIKCWNIKGTVITTTGNFEGTWSANGKNNKFEATVEGNKWRCTRQELSWRPEQRTSYEGDENNLYLLYKPQSNTQDIPYGFPCS